MWINSRYFLAALGITTILVFAEPDHLRTDNSISPASIMSDSPVKRDSPVSDKTLYVITTKDGTSRDQFNSEVKGFDRGVGHESVHDAVGYQVYTTLLTESQADEMKKIDCVRFVWKEVDPDDDNDPDDDRAVPLGVLEKPEHHLIPRGGYSVLRENSASQLNLFSWNKPGLPKKDYRADISLGKGNTLYVIDSGFNLRCPDLAATSERTVEHYVVPNRKTLPLSRMLQDPAWRKPEDLTDWSDHGTSVASLAGGLEYGVASNANLYLVKGKNAWHQPGYSLTKGTYTISALSDAFVHILGHISSANTKGKAAVNMSFGKTASQAFDDLFDKFIKDLEDLDVVPVTSAGNTGEERGSGLHQKAPANLGTRDNALITVGGVNPDGDLWSMSTPRVPGKAGSITVYAQASEVKAYNAYGHVDAHMSGTSMSSPLIAGLVVYFLGNDDYKNYFRRGRVATDVKRFLYERASFQRVSVPTIPRRYPRVGTVNVGYNLARGPAQQCKRSSKRDSSSQCELEPVLASESTSDDCTEE